MIDLANPINERSRLNRGLTMWAICPTSFGRPGRWPDLVTGRSGQIFGHIQSGTRGWNPTCAFVTPGFNEYRFDTTTMYTSMPTPPYNSGSMSAVTSFFYDGVNSFCNPMCGTRTQVLSGDSSWYIQHRTSVGMSICVVGTNGTDFIIVTPSTWGVAGFYTLGFSWDDSARVVTGYSTRVGSRGISVASGTMSGSVRRDPHQAIFLGAAQFAGSYADGRIPSVTSGRIWNRTLSNEEWKELFADQAAAYATTLNRTTNRNSVWFLPPAAATIVKANSLNINQAVKAASTY
jgi:hypothetical protein